MSLYKCSDGYGKWCRDCFKLHKIDEYCPITSTTKGNPQ